MFKIMKQTLTTNVKFKLGQTVWFMQNNAVRKAIISRCSLVLHHTNRGDKDEEVYQVNIGTANWVVPIEDLFGSKDELIEEIFKNES